MLYVLLAVSWVLVAVLAFVLWFVYLENKDLRDLLLADMVVTLSLKSGGKPFIDTIREVELEDNLWEV